MDSSCELLVFGSDCFCLLIKTTQGRAQAQKGLTSTAGAACLISLLILLTLVSPRRALPLIASAASIDGKYFVLGVNSDKCRVIALYLTMETNSGDTMTLTPLVTAEWPKLVPDLPLG